MERESRTITTPGGIEVKIKTYFTARERNTLRDSLLRVSKIEVGENGETTMKDMEINGEFLTKSQNELIKIGVISYGDINSPDAILETILESRADEYDFIVEELGKINQNFQKTK